MKQLPNYFTHYWTQETFERERARAESAPASMKHTAGNGFRKAGLRRRDFLYIVSVLDGELYLIGRMQVRGIYSRSKAAALLGTKTNNLWDAKEHVVEIPETGTRDRYDLKVPISIVQKLQFLSASGPRGLAFRDERHLNQQTLRVKRRLLPESANALDRLLDGNGPAVSGGTGSLVDVARDDYQPSDDDTRRLALRQIWERQGQADFRRNLLRRYGTRCMISGSTIDRIIDAAHIRPYRGESDNHEENGLLLRTDLHALYDLGLLGIEPVTLKIRLHPSLRRSEYGELHGQRLKCDKAVPAESAIKRSWEIFQRILRSKAVSQSF